MKKVFLIFTIVLVFALTPTAAMAQSMAQSVTLKGDGVNLKMTYDNHCRLAVKGTGQDVKVTYNGETVLKGTDDVFHPRKGKFILSAKGNGKTYTKSMTVKGKNVVLKDDKALMKYIFKCGKNRKKVPECLWVRNPKKFKKDRDFSDDFMKSMGYRGYDNMIMMGYTMTIKKEKVNGKMCTRIVTSFTKPSKKVLKRYRAVDKFVKGSAKCRKCSTKKTVKAISAYINKRAKYGGGVTRYDIPCYGKGQCTSYAYIGQYCLEECGLTAAFVSSSDHSWNLVKVKGKWYHTDFCWNDCLNSTTKYTLRGSKYMKNVKHHKMLKEYAKRYKVSKGDL